MEAAGAKDSVTGGLQARSTALQPHSRNTPPESRASVCAGLFGIHSETYSFLSVSVFSEWKPVCPPERLSLTSRNPGQVSDDLTSRQTFQQSQYVLPTAVARLLQVVSRFWVSGGVFVAAYSLSARLTFP